MYIIYKYSLARCLKLINKLHMEEYPLEEMKDVPSSQYAKFPKRPPIPPNPAGTMVKLSTNYFKMMPKPSNYVFVYAIKFEPSIPDDNTPLKKRVVKSMKEVLEPEFKKYICTGNIMYTTFDAGASPVVQETALFDTRYIVTLTRAHIISLEDILHPHKDMAKAQTANTFFNILIKSLLHSLNMIPVGRTGRYLIPQEGTRINDYSLQIWPGYKTSVKLCDAGLLLEIDYTSRILSQKSALQVIEELKENGSRNLQADVKEYFKGRSVIAWYGNKRNYIIDDVDFNLNPDTHSFATPEGMMNITTYMLKKYQIKIKHRNQPLLLHKKRIRGVVGSGPESEEKIYLVPEVCGLTGLPDEMRSNFQAMKQIAVHTKLTPDQRTDKMSKLLKLFNSMNISRERREGQPPNRPPEDQPAEILKRWGFEILPDPIQVRGRKLPPVTVGLGGDQTIKPQGNGQFFFKQRIVTPVSYTHLTLPTICSV
eukprot:TRINITY_DN1798_c0_g1_i9.p1 TRINITY_DN1798_c0_g1~~TRINITY_DN1798_c0_g1_i9.p1  ORF type:complete len:481 (-),score=89.30 TRINITY_DN1798_c0_g1_i9:46-1488(-)